MAKKTFKMFFYRVTLAGSMTTIAIGNTKIKAQGIIHVGGDADEETGQLIIYFLAPDSPVSNPPAYTKSTGTLGNFCVPYNQMPFYIDLLRNEKPVWFQLFTDKPEYNCVRTSWEPVGVEDDNT
jgi:hypothetical protein